MSSWTQIGKILKILKKCLFTNELQFHVRYLVNMTKSSWSTPEEGLFDLGYSRSDPKLGKACRRTLV